MRLQSGKRKIRCCMHTGEHFKTCIPCRGLLDWLLQGIYYRSVFIPGDLFRRSKLSGVTYREMLLCAGGWTT